MPLILNIETSSEICSASLSKNGGLLCLKENYEENSHSKLLTILINSIFSEMKLTISDIDAVAVSKGPGSYTGLRIGVSVSKGICYAINKPLIAVDTLKIIASSIFQNIQNNIFLKNEKDNILICPLIDARRMEVYSAIYDVNLNIIKDVAADIIDSESFNKLLNCHIIIFGGTGAEKCKNIINHSNAIFVDNIKASASYMAGLSQLSFENKNFENTAYFEPMYLKEFIAGKPKKNL
jgi:tRNA threonylcarbamoyladenosine biosynthesis protein TsaB